jgi:hypothetical protein
MSDGCYGKEPLPDLSKIKKILASILTTCKKTKERLPRSLTSIEEGWRSPPSSRDQESVETLFSEISRPLATALRDLYQELERLVPIFINLQGTRLLCKEKLYFLNEADWSIVYYLCNIYKDLEEMILAIPQGRPISVRENNNAIIECIETSEIRGFMSS